MKKQIASSLLIPATLLSTIIPLGGSHHTAHAEQMGQLSAKGTHIQQDGHDFQIKGVNAGNVFTTERWLGGYSEGSHNGGYQGVFNYIQSKVESEIKSKDKNISDKKADRKAANEAHRILNRYAQNRWSDKDFKRVHDMGFNTIRLPISFINVTNYSRSMNDPEDGNHKHIKDKNLSNLQVNDKGLQEIRNFVNRAKQHHLRVIIDMHKVPNEMNGSAKKDTFWTDSKAQDKTIQIWKAISNEFKNEPAVAGYDILNEPYGKVGGMKSKHNHKEHVNEFYKRAVQAIRNQNHDNHLIFLEGIWKPSALENPQDYGNSKNLVYEYHEYPGSKDKKDNQHERDFFRSKIKSAKNADKNFNVPTYFGEFNSLNSGKNGGYKQVEDAVEEMNKAHVSWSFFNYDKQDKGSPWGIVHYDDVKNNIFDENFGEKINPKENQNYDFFQKELKS